MLKKKKKTVTISRFFGAAVLTVAEHVKLSRSV